MAADWHNAMVATDVNNDRRVTPMDVLQVCNKLNSDGSGPLPGLAPGAQPNAYYDTSGDGFLSSVDALRVINAVNADLAGNRLTEIAAISNHSIQATFDAPIADALMFPEAYVLTGPDSSRLEILSVIKGNVPNQVILVTAGQTPVSYAVQLNPAVSMANSVVASLAGLGIGPTNGPTDLAKPQLIDVIPVDETTMLATYNRPMGASAINPANYKITNDAGQPIEVIGAQFAEGESSVVQLQTAPQSYTGTTVNIQNVTDSVGQVVYFDGRKLLTSKKGAVASVAATSSTRVVVVFNEAMSDNALAPHHYAIKDPSGKSLLVTDARFGGPLGMVVVLTTAPQANVVYQLNVSLVTDLKGEALEIKTGSFQGSISAPALLKAVPTLPTRLVLTFTGPVGDSALAPSTYKIEELNAAGTPSGVTVPITDVRFLGDQRTVLQLTTASQADAQYRITTTDALTDVAGSPLPSVAKQFLGIGSRPALVSATSSGPSTMLVTFTEAMSDDALAPSSYEIKSASGATLRVLSVGFVGTEQRVVELTTDPQNGGTYKVESITATDLDGNKAVVPADPMVNQFQGVAASALAQAIPTLATRIVLTFTGPVGDSAMAPSTYKIEELNAAGAPNGATVSITGARFIGDQRKVVELTTASQSDAPYRITTTSALTDVAGSPLPAVAQGFQGIGSRPTLVSATSAGPSTVLVTFSEAMSDDSLAPSSYQIRSATGETLRVLSARFLGTELRVIELITDPQGDGPYTVESITATDLGSNKAVVPAAPTVNTFPGRGTPSEAPEISGPPRVVGVASINNTELIVVFSEPMADSAETSTNYVIVQENVNSEAGVLRVTDAEFYLGNPSVVKLTTLSQSELAYRVTVVNVTDRAGNALAPKVTSSGEVVDPTSGTFPGTPDASGIPTDTDGDGLSDSEEMRGWFVTISLANQTVVERGVTSDPMLADTDGDGVLDRAELASRSDPRDDDSDDDELPDAEELNDRRGNPTRQDTDNDGMTDLAEKIGWSINVTLADGSVVNQQVTSNPYLSDTDFDGLLDRLEQLTQVDPRNPDSDDDGASDGDEVLDGQDPATNDPGNGANDRERDPRVVGAASLSNTTVLVSFSEAMDGGVLDDVSFGALNTAHYFIVQQSVNPEVGFVPILSAVFNSEDRRSVLLTTASQNELTYSVSALNVTDLDGNALAPAVLAGGQRVDPRTVLFPGTPPSGVQIVDTDGDGLSDNVEVRGWVVNVTMLDGSKIERQVTSNPGDPSKPVDHPFNVAARDADGDALPDAQELNLGIDPRAADTDGDQLNDYAEFNEIYSDPTNQDSDGDRLDDFLEFAFFMTSPVFADTDGDQIDDGDEIIGNRNARVSDLPRPEIDVGAVNLQLDVRFSESNAKESRDLETRSITSTLSQSESRSLSRQFTANVEAHMEAGFGDGGEITVINGGPGPYFRVGGSAGFTFQQTEESASETQRSYENSFATEAEVTSGFTVEREVVGAVMQVAVDLRNVSNLAYRVKNLQVTAFIQDPQNHTRLTPVATLLPDNEPEEGFTLGPLVTNRGPLIFSNSTIVPTLVDSLMANSSGLIFRISNYDIINEDGRNFAFISQDVVERTGQMVIDFGGARSLRAQVSGETIDENQPGDETEIHRVSTSAGQVIDTNFDGAINDADRRATFDAVGKEVGITLFEALSAVGLDRFEARIDDRPCSPTLGRYVDYVPGEDEPVDVSTPTEEDRILNSYSTFVEVVDGESRERIFRIRGVANDLIIEKYWEILTPLGIDQQTDLDDLILKTDSPISLNFVQDLDGDRLPADVEFLLRTSDTPLPFGAVVPGSTDVVTESVRFNTDPGLATGTLVRVAADRGGLTAGDDYFLRNLSGGSYSFYDTAADASADTGRIDLTGNITTGIFRPASPTATNATTESVTFDPGLATATRVHVLATGGGLIAGADYFIRNLGGGSYSFYDKADRARAGTDAGRIDVTGNIKAGVFDPTSPTRVYYPTFTDFISRSVTFDPRFATATLVKVTEDTGGLMAETRDYFLRHLGGGSYSFYATAANALADTDRINLTDSITAGVFSPTAHGRDTDRDGLDDRFEALIGWTVSTPLRTYTVYSAPNRRDSNFDTPKPGVDSDQDEPPVEDRLEFDGADGNIAPAGWDDKNNNRLRDRFEVFQVDADDFVLDAIRKDTDGDGISDATEIIGFRITPIDAPGSTKHIARTDPNNPFTDSDTFTDGFEKLVGLDPTDGSDTDEDGDGLPDRVETVSGWLVRTFGVSESRFLQDEATEVTGFSRIDSEDSDDDGLTDYEEFFLKTNAESKDTDGDDIEDRIEHLGYALGHKVGKEDIGIIKTNPLDADTDNDLRSDGDEAELVDVELERWVVQATGTVKSGEVSSSSAYQVFSNPLVADNDFDGLVDGEEFFGLAGAAVAYRTDPNNANTDGDKRNDGVEVRGGMNPLRDDIRVTVVIDSIEYADSSFSAYSFALKVRQPGEGAGGLRDQPHTLLEINNKQIGRVSVQNRSQCCGNPTVRVFYEWSLDVNGVLTAGRTDYEPAITTDNTNAGADQLYDPGVRGVPLGAQFRVGYTNAFPFDFVANEWFTYSGNETAAVRYILALDGVDFRLQGVIPTPGFFTKIDLAKNLPVGSRSFTFGLANDERFSLEGSILRTGAEYQTGPNSNDKWNWWTSDHLITARELFRSSDAATWNTLNLGGLEGEKAFQASPEGAAGGSPTESRTVFSSTNVADKFIEDYYFEETVNGQKVKIQFYYIIG